ncbi:hypothetical protein CRUP_001991, partial [Coryphaenoides rupestris]
FAALHHAALNGNLELISLLLESQAAVDIRDQKGQIPLHLAAQHGHYDVVVQLLLSSNMCAALLEPKPGDSTDPNGTSPLHLAAKNGHIDIISCSIIIPGFPH